MGEHGMAECIAGQAQALMGSQRPRCSRRKLEIASDGHQIMLYPKGHGSFRVGRGGDSMYICIFLLFIVLLGVRGVITGDL